MSKRDEKTKEQKVREATEQLASRFVEAICQLDGVREGRILHSSPNAKAQYRRLDCDQCVLAYVRPTPRRRCVNIGITGRWPLRRSRLRVASAGLPTLRVSNDADIVEAVELIKK